MDLTFTNMTNEAVTLHIGDGVVDVHFDRFPLTPIANIKSVRSKILKLPPGSTVNCAMANEA